jgi:hypothetical protein
MVCRQGTTAVSVSLLTVRIKGIVEAELYT